MAKSKNKIGEITPKKVLLICGALTLFAVLIYMIPSRYEFDLAIGASATSTLSLIPQLPPIDKAAYNQKILAVSQIPKASSTPEFLSGATTTISNATSTKKLLWPAKIVYPNPGAILPWKRIIAFYGNFYSKGMGVLGEYPEDVMISKLNAELAKWNAADPLTPAIPAIDYIAITAQGTAQKDGKYRLRMPDSQLDRAVALAKKVNGIVILDVQVGLSDLPTELPQYEKYLSMPEVHLAIDPEFSMKTGAKPGSVIGTFSAGDINFAVNYLAKLVKDHNLPPKVLVIHRFTQDMVTGYSKITPLPEVQIVMDMDGWGSPAKKKGTYQHVIYPEPVQFTGFKLFYKNDLFAPSTHMLTPAELLSLTPQPLFIQYQ